MEFGLCHFVFLDNGCPFKGVFVVICKALEFNYDILAKRNHKGLIAEYFHRALNKAISISMKDRENNDDFVLTRITVEYAWNSVSIDGTNILRSIVAVGSGFWFPIDINLSAIPQLTQNNA